MCIEKQICVNGAKVSVRGPMFLLEVLKFLLEVSKLLILRKNGIFLKQVSIKKYKTIQC